MKTTVNDAELATKREPVATYDGRAPDAFRSLEAVREYGWLEVGYEDTIFEGLKTLVASVFLGGSVASKTYIPAFALDDPESDVLETADWPMCSVPTKK